MTGKQSAEPDISLVKKKDDDQVTLLIDGVQAMQGWESDLMRRAADLVSERGTHFLEAGLGLGLSALRIAERAGTQRHVVVEKYAKVIEFFQDEHQVTPPALEIVHADFFDYINELVEESLDGVFFDPELPRALFEDRDFIDGFMPKIVRALRPGGAFVPMFSVDGAVPDAATCTTTPSGMLERYLRFFRRATVERQAYTAYADTQYTPGRTGEAFILCFYR